MSKLWRVYGRTDYAAVSAQSGVPVEAIMCGLGPETHVGDVEAPTKGAAIMAAHEKFPRIRVADLNVYEVVLPPAEERQP